MAGKKFSLSNLLPVKHLADNLSKKLSKKQQQIAENVEKQDEARLDNYYYEQSGNSSFALLRQRMKNNNSFANLEKEFQQGMQAITTDDPNFAYHKSNLANLKNRRNSGGSSMPAPLQNGPFADERILMPDGTLKSERKNLTSTNKKLKITGLLAAVGTALNKRNKSGKHKAEMPLIKSLSFFQKRKAANNKRTSAVKDTYPAYNPQSVMQKYNVAEQRPEQKQLKKLQQAKKESFLHNFYEIVLGTLISLLPSFNKKDRIGSAVTNDINKKNLEQINRDLDVSIAKLQKQEKRRRRITVFCFTCSLLLLTLAVAGVIMQQTRAKIHLYILKNGDLEQKYSSFGFVAREERVLYAPVAGELQAIKAEGSLVAAEQEVANIVTVDISDIKSKNDNIEQQISEQILTMLKQGRNLQANQLFSKSDSSMLPTINLLRHDLSHNVLSHLNTYVYNLQPLMQERNFSLKQVNLADPVIENLRTEQKVLAHELKEKARIIETPTAGLISYKINPLAIDVNTETIQSMSYDQFINYYNAAKPSVSTNGTKIKEKLPIIRLIDTRYQYFLLQVANAKTSDFTVNNNYKLEVAGLGQVIEKCNLLRVTPDASGVLLLLKCDRNVESLLDKVAIKANLIKATHSGLIIPKAALLYDNVNRESTAYIYVVKAGFIEKEQVRVLESNEQNAIIQGLNEKETVIKDGAIIVLNPRQVKAGQQVT